MARLKKTEKTIEERITNIEKQIKDIQMDLNSMFNMINKEEEQKEEDSIKKFRKMFDEEHELKEEDKEEPIHINIVYKTFWF